MITHTRLNNRKYVLGLLEAVEEMAAALAKVTRRHRQAAADVQETQVRGGRWYKRAVERRDYWAQQVTLAEGRWVSARVGECKTMLERTEVLAQLRVEGYAKFADQYT